MEDEIKKISEEIEEDIEKDVTQKDTIDPSVEQHMLEMGFLWDVVQNKLHKDKVCFECKKALELEGENSDKMHVLEANGVEKGVVAFVCICKECYDKAKEKFQKEQDEIVKEELENE